MTTILAPRSLRALIAWVITLTWVATALVPQMTTQSDFGHFAGIGSGKAAGSHHIAGPGQMVQIVPKNPEVFLRVAQPLRWKSRWRPVPPIVPCIENRAQIRLRPEFFLGAQQPLRDQVRAPPSAVDIPSRFAILLLCGACPHQRFRRRSG